MKILWAPNPLRSVVELDDADRAVLRERLKVELIEDGFNVTDEFLEERYNGYVAELAGEHDGDCTCIPCSCAKCHAEDTLGICTIDGLGKHPASKIKSAFRDGASIDEAIQRLADYRPIYKPSPTWPEEEWSKHVPRWIEEGKRAHAWLVKYRAEHFGAAVLPNSESK